MMMRGTELERAADVICQYKMDGTVIPLKIRVEDDDGEYQTYQIKSYKYLSASGELKMPNEVNCQSTQPLAFECKIQVFTMTTRIMLYYSRIENRWKVKFIG